MVSFCVGSGDGSYGTLIGGCALIILSFGFYFGGPGLQILFG